MLQNLIAATQQTPGGGGEIVILGPLLAYGLWKTMTEEKRRRNARVKYLRRRYNLD